MKGILRLLLVFFSVLMLQACVSYSDVEFLGMQGYKINKFTGEELELELMAKLKNPNNYRIKVVDTDMNIFINGAESGKAVLGNKVILKRQSEETHKILIKAQLKNAFSSGLTGLLSMFTGQPMKVGIKGDIKARAMGISKKVPMEFEQNITPGTK